MAAAPLEEGMAIEGRLPVLERIGKPHPRWLAYRARGLNQVFLVFVFPLVVASTFMILQGESIFSIPAVPLTIMSLIAALSAAFAFFWRWGITIDAGKGVVRKWLGFFVPGGAEGLTMPVRVRSYYLKQFEWVRFCREERTGARDGSTYTACAVYLMNKDRGPGSEDLEVTWFPTLPEACAMAEEIGRFLNVRAEEAEDFGT